MSVLCDVYLIAAMLEPRRNGGRRQDGSCQLLGSVALRGGAVAAAGGDGGRQLAGGATGIQKRHATRHRPVPTTSFALGPARQVTDGH